MKINRTQLTCFEMAGMTLLALVVGIAMILLLLGSCSPEDFEFPSSPSEMIRSTEEAELFVDVMFGTPTPTPEPAPERLNLLLLGGDYRTHRRGTDYGDKTDAMLLASIVMSDPIQITVTQFPRNFWTPVSAGIGMGVMEDDMWLFHVYRREGFDGLRWYFAYVFDVRLDAIAYINMDNFVRLVDDLGGIPVPVAWSSYEPMSGEEALAYIRDNDNNWGCAAYDCGDRQYAVLRGLASKVKTNFREDPLVTARLFWDRWGGLVETDLSAFEQFHYLITVGWQIAVSDYELSFRKVTTSGFVEYGDTPLEVRGWIVTDPAGLKDWFK